MYVPHIIFPTRITSSTRTLIDNIYSNSVIFNEGISGNLTISTSDHLAQFLIIPEAYEHPPKQHEIYKRDTKNFDSENFKTEISNIDWPSVINMEANNPNQSLNNFESTLNSIIDKYMPVRKLTKKNLNRSKNHG